MKYKLTTAKKIRVPAIAMALILTLVACSDIFNPDTSPDLDHSHTWSGWTVVTEPSFKSIGTDVQFCDICGEVEFRHIEPPAVTNLAEWNNAVAEISKDVKTGTDEVSYLITIKGNITGIRPTTTPNFGNKRGINIILAGTGSLSMATGAGHMVCVGNGQTLVIDGDNLTLKGRSGNDANLAVIGVMAGGKAVLNSGIITKNTSANGGGVHVYANGTFAMSGGVISDNSATSNGGGVIVEKDGIFAMEGGKISGNSATSNGGGVLVGIGGKFLMNGGEISGNTSNGTVVTNGGGGVVI
jgi:hypothetical protein